MRLQDNKKSLQLIDLFKSIMGKTESSVMLGLVLLIIIMSMVSPVFLNTTNIFNVLSQISRYGIISVGMALIIITGGPHGAAKAIEELNMQDQITLV